MKLRYITGPPVQLSGIEEDEQAALNLLGELMVIDAHNYYMLQALKVQAIDLLNRVDFHQLDVTPEQAQALRNRLADIERALSDIGLRAQSLSRIDGLEITLGSHSYLDNLIGSGVASINAGPLVILGWVVVGAVVAYYAPRLLDLVTAEYEGAKITAEDTPFLAQAIDNAETDEAKAGIYREVREMVDKAYKKGKFDGAAAFGSGALNKIFMYAATAGVGIIALSKQIR